MGWRADVNAAGKVSVPTRLMAATKYELAMAALRASTGHIGSLSAPTVAAGLNTICAPFSPKPIQFSGWCRP